MNWISALREWWVWWWRGPVAAEPNATPTTVLPLADSFSLKAPPQSSVATRRSYCRAYDPDGALLYHGPLFHVDVDPWGKSKYLPPLRVYSGELLAHRTVIVARLVLVSEIFGKCAVDGPGLAPEGGILEMNGGLEVTADE